MAAWVCAACGGENPEGMRFCGHCGTPAAAATAPAEEPRSPGAAEDVSDALRSFVAGAVADRLVEARGRLPEERRLITALFADVSGFTSLAERLDPDQLLEVIDPVIATLSDIVGRYEGYVEKFAGDALLALFGAPVAHEDDAARACLVALEMHRELARVCRELPYGASGLTLHVGVNSGHGIARILGSEARMDYAVLGDAVILAQRLESAAPPGETYVSQATHRLTEGRFLFEPVGELTLKGKSEPVPAWRLLRERARRAASTRDAAPSRLVGRDEELRALTAALEEVSASRGGVVAVTGEAGVGKSRLTEEAKGRAGALGVRWLETRCLSYGAALAYWPYAELLRAFADIRIDELPDQALSRLSAALAGIDASAEGVPFFARLLGLPPPEGRAEIARLEPQAFRRALHEAVSSWARALAREQPIVIAVEDVHWADTSSVALTAELARLCPQERLLLYLIGRPEASSTLAEITAGVPAGSRCGIPLEPLDDACVRALLVSALSGEPPAALPSFVSARTRGNPFFVEELLRSLRETNALYREDGSWSIRPGWDADQVPPTIEGVLAARIDLLPRGAAALLQLASVVGRRVPVPLLWAVQEDLVDLEHVLEELVSSAFLDRVAEQGEETVIFHHALIQDVAYSRLTRRRRRELHGRVAASAEALYGAGDDVVDLLARHLYLAEAGARAVDYLVRAGERARRLYANDEAIVHFTRAAEVARGDADAGPRLNEILLALADLHELVGHYEEALALYAEVAEATSDVRAWRGRAATLRRQGEYGAALELLDEALARADLGSGDARLLWLERGWNLSQEGRFADAISALETGLELPGSSADPVAGQLLLQLTVAELDEGCFEPALEHGLRAREIFERHDDVRGRATAMRIVGDLYRQLGRLDEARDALRHGLQLAERVGSVEELGGCLINLGLVELDRGALEDAIACDRRAIEEFERVGHSTGRAIGYANLAEKLMHAGRPDDALSYCGRALELARSCGHTPTVADTLQTMAAIALRQGNAAEAAERAQRAADLFLEMGALPAAADCLALAAEALDAAGDGRRASEAAARARSLA